MSGLNSQTEWSVYAGQRGDFLILGGKDSKYSILTSGVSSIEGAGVLSHQSYMKKKIGITQNN